MLKSSEASPPPAAGGALTRSQNTKHATKARTAMALEQCASFEPDEHLATLVLRQVGDVRDRLALECVSRVWRAAGQIPGVWQSQNLILTGALAARLTDARVRQVLRRAGPNLRALVTTRPSHSPASSSTRGGRPEWEPQGSP